MKEGTIIKVKAKRLPLFRHYGIIVGSEGDEQYVLHNTPFKGSSVDSLEDFQSSRGAPVSVHETELTELDTTAIIERFQACDRPYRLFSFNCEHFVDCMREKRQTSPQLQLSLFIIFLISTLLFLSMIFR
ncbi:lecithin retinol acyltransferase family protein [Phaeodactylibacter xiamenensis]|uniref:lecithin retinol acyltransferase family protein n=1 Tax=Phaeodactylibacter xiamenensis TaxID=1524460 RepID=UPI0024A98281|nr:lecithin retinol acyltransferase family protein [Phaeodactylibacter xiamenensis]